MGDTFQLEIATPERGIVNEPVRDATLPGEEGYFEVLFEHGALLSMLDPGVVTYHNEAGEQMLAIDGGFAEVLENHVRVLTTHVWRPEEIDLERARRDVEEGLRAVRRAHEYKDSANALRAYKTARGRVEAAERAGSEAH